MHISISYLFTHPFSYILDLVDSYLTVFPDKEEELLFGSEGQSPLHVTSHLRTEIKKVRRSASPLLLSSSSSVAVFVADTVIVVVVVKVSHNRCVV